MFVFAALALGLAEPVSAQFGRGGFGDSSSSTSPFRLLSSERVQGELKLTDAQLDQIKKLEEEFENAQQEQPRTQFPEDPEERAKFFADFRKRQETRNAEAMLKVKAALQDNQFERLSQLRYRNLGTRAFENDDLATSLKLSDDQKAKISQLIGDSSSALMQLGRRASREEREKVTTEWNDKILAVLSNDQKTQWEAKQGAPLPEEGNTTASPTTTGNTTPQPT
ncbi:MAG: hypothetical protein KDA84_12385, partial [Planctomycetaceae bacterium]|nr:hypothetical protein [Planctomycetaceae bacterium]